MISSPPIAAKVHAPDLATSFALQELLHDLQNTGAIPTADINHTSCTIVDLHQYQYHPKRHHEPLFDDA